MDLLEMLKKDIGSPQKRGRTTPQAEFIKSKMGEIQEARNAGYAYKDIAHILSKMGNVEIKMHNLIKLFSAHKNKTENGRFIEYTLGNERLATWAEFESCEAITKWLEEKAWKKSAAGAYAVEARLISKKVMSRAQYEKRQNVQRSGNNGTR